ncbi:MAG: carbohydrate kinase [Acholeplasmatales bacterium]|nr:carbohydrate kinase [Acholeplasmatales bacterium]MBR6289681.1 carbohydrate kinase [Acholeplasmatales bacterium]
MILCIGEILVDMIGNEKNGVTSFERYPGGAPFNVCAGINRLGGKAGFIGSVGNDLMGHFLKSFVDKLNLEYQDIYLDNEHNTTLAFVANSADGERSFSFNRKNTADYQIKIESLEKIKDANIIHLGSLMLSEKKGIKIADEVVRLTKKYNKLLSFDVNYRDDIFNSKEEAINISLTYLKKADIVKLSEDEVKLLSGLDDLDLGIKKITLDNQLVLVTLGSNGSRFYFKGMTETVPTMKIKAVDTTGAGDAFYASILKHVDELDFNNIKKEELVNILSDANICGARACMQKGSLLV